MEIDIINRYKKEIISFSSKVNSYNSWTERVQEDTVHFELSKVVNSRGTDYFLECHAILLEGVSCSVNDDIDGEYPVNMLCTNIGKQLLEQMKDKFTI